MPVRSLAGSGDKLFMEHLDMTECASCHRSCSSCKVVSTPVKVPERTQSTIGPGLTIIVPVCDACLGKQNLITLKETSGLLVDYAALDSAAGADNAGLMERKCQYESAGSAAPLMPGGRFLNQIGSSSSSRRPGKSASEDVRI